MLSSLKARLLCLWLADRTAVWLSCALCVELATIRRWWGNLIFLLSAGFRKLARKTGPRLGRRQRPSSSPGRPKQPGKGRDKARSRTSHAREFEVDKSPQDALPPIHNPPCSNRPAYFPNERSVGGSPPGPAPSQTASAPMLAMSPKPRITS